MVDGRIFRCAGCLAEIAGAAAFAIMHERDLAELEQHAEGRLTAIEGPGKFHAAAVCSNCFHEPEHRKVTLKAHFALPQDVERMLGRAGSSSIGA